MSPGAITPHEPHVDVVAVIVVIPLRLDISAASIRDLNPVAVITSAGRIVSSARVLRTVQTRTVVRVQVTRVAAVQNSVEVAVASTQRAGNCGG